MVQNQSISQETPHKLSTTTLHPPDPVFWRSRDDIQRVLHCCEKLTRELTFACANYKGPSLLWMSQQKDPSREPPSLLKSSSDSGPLACRTALLVASSMWRVHLSAFTSAGDHQVHIKVAGCGMSSVETWDITEGGKVPPSQTCGL